MIYPSGTASGIIPAYAGSTGGRGRRVGCGGIIPAYAGSTPAGASSGRGSGGSSPHTRGAHVDGRSEGHQPGIIPAYAGSTAGGELGMVLGQDHPRIRGEHRACAFR